jgi:N6-adenosine-specific RNA methylase IME4
MGRARLVRGSRGSLRLGLLAPITMRHEYATIVADPPWPQKGGGPLKGGHAEGFVGTAGSLPLPYSTMTVAQIADMAVCEVAAKDAHLYLWTTNRFLPDAFAVMAAWGFRYSTTLVWAKAPIGAGLGGAHGIATEFVLFGRRGNLRATDRIGRNWFNWKRPYDERGKPMHSAKPPEFYTDVVEPISPGPRLELFARRLRPGWDLWGDQAPSGVDLPQLAPGPRDLLGLLEDGAA